MIANAGNRLRAALESIKTGMPPIPSAERFKPLRLGLIGLWEYENDEFCFHDGRLALLGRNGSGKTKILEVTSPFLLDANLTARRLDPFGNASRSMRDNLLYGGHQHRIGYVWCEYGRITASGLPEYVTIGAGLRAQAVKAGPPESWYFLTTQRVGVDLQLFGAGGSLRNRGDLAEALEGGQVFNTADDYRREVGERLFGMTPARYRSLVELLLTMRRPKLSENFGVDRLATMIRDGLPPVDSSLIDELALGFDELARDREDFEALERVGREVRLFLRSYRTYARRMVRFYAAELRSANTRYDKVTRRKREAENDLAEFQATLAELRARQVETNHSLIEQEARVKTLEQRPELEQHTALVALDQQARKAEEQLERATSRLATATHDHRLSMADLEVAESALANSRAEFGDAEATAMAAAEPCGLLSEHERHSERLQSDLEAAKRLLISVVGSKRAAVRNARAKREQVDQAQAEFDRAQARRDDLVARHDELGRTILSQQAALTAETEAVSTAVMSWAEECREVEVPATVLESMLRAVESAGRAGVEAPVDQARRIAAEAESRLLTERARWKAESERLRTNHNALFEQRRVIAAEEDVAPPPTVPRRDRDAGGLLGAPLWRIVEFASDVPETVQANVETALLGAGLLDAWVTPDGAVLEAGTLDVVLTARSGAVHEHTLSQVLKATEQDHVDVSEVVALLERIGFHDRAADHAGDWISADGGWALGPLRGQTEGRPASYIGAAAREAARRRRLQEIDRQLDELERQIEVVREASAVLDGRIERLRFERDTCPNVARIIELSMRLDGLLEQAAALSAEIRQAERRCEIRLEAVRVALSDLESYARENYVGTTFEALHTLDENLTNYQGQLAELFSQAGRLSLYLSQAESVRSRLVRAEERLELEAEEHERIAEEAITLRSEYETRHELIGADVEQVIEELKEARKRVERLREVRSEAESAIQTASEGVGSAKGTLQIVEESRREREAERAAAVSGFETLRTNGFLALAEVPKVEETAGTLTTSLEDARAAYAHLQQEEMDEKARNAARDNVDERFRSLQSSIGGPDWRPWGAHEGDLFVVKVAHNGEDLKIPEVNVIVENEIATRKAYLDDRERELFADVLIGRVGEHLRECRARASDLYASMNELLSKRRTASGRQMRLVWEADPEAGPKVRRALEIFDQQSVALLTDEARRELVDFLAERVRETRDADQEGDWREHLREALDYRKWPRFRIQIRDKVGDPWTTLTDAKHQQGSGGEKAVMLQLPLFVAAAAHYVGAAKTAPHPIFLDEAFAGIDAEMRGECMKLLVDLDLDFVLASHDEWGFRAEVPGLATYQLFRDPSVPGVLATPFLWDGTASSELRDSVLDGRGNELFTEEGDGIFDG